MTINELRHRLKLLSKPTLEKICEETGLTAVEQHIVMLSFLKSLPVDYISDSLNMSQSTYSRTKKRALTKICDFLDNNMTII